MNKYKRIKNLANYTGGRCVALNTVLSILYGHSVTSDGCFINSAELM